MSEEGSITAVRNEKNPKRVEAGKKLAEYNKAARERTVSTRNDPEDNGDVLGSSLPLIAGACLIAGLAYLYTTRETTSETPNETPSETSNETPSETSNKPRKLISFD